MPYEFQGKEVEAGGTIKFSTPGDYVVGTLLNMKPNIKTDFGLTNFWSLRAKNGSFHNSLHNVVDVEATTISEGDEVGFFAKPGGVLDEKIKKIKLGQIFKVELKELKASKYGAGHEQKIYSVQQGPMDEVIGEEVETE